MKAVFLEADIPYTGRELRSHWAYTEHGVAGDSIVAFAGPCDVPTDALVDEEDRRAGAVIRARRMVHFLVEHFDSDLEKAVLRQLLLVSLVAAAVNERVGRPVVSRSGNDLRVGDRKLTVSVATLSPVSALLHLGVNVDPEGAPVPAVGLGELGLDERDFARAVLEGYARVAADVARLKSKVRGVR